MRKRQGRGQGASDGKALEGVQNEARPVALTPADNLHLRPAVAAGKDGRFLVLWEVNRGLDNHRIEEGTVYRLCDHELRFSFIPPA